ncbi:MAG: Holliday junction resolvase [Acidobacteria bacterium]|nr:Holliday junction resolvase [Acidobacteriota bacterium]
MFDQLLQQDSTTLFFIVAVIVTLIVMIVLYFSQRAKIGRLQTQIEIRAKQQYDNWRTKELEAIRNEQREVAQREARVNLEQWKVHTEAGIRTDAIGRSRAVIVGKITEHLTPFMPDFKFNPKEARFIGSPIDLLVFDGLDDGDLRHIYFVEVKTGASATLSSRQRQIRDAILSGRVRWIELRMNS